MEKILAPMKAHIGKKEDLTRKNMIFEPKLDGIRALCYVNEGLHFYSRNKKDITSEYTEFNFRNSIKAEKAILDGEIIVLNDVNNPSFELWQKGYSSIYVVFDILMLNERFLTELPLIERKQILENVINDGIQVEKCVYTLQGEALWQVMKKRNMEGVIAKQKDSQYHAGKRSSQWLKIKLYKTLEALIVGYTSDKRNISSLLLGIYRKKKLIYIGKVGTGFALLLNELFEKLQELNIDNGLSVENIAPGDISSRTVYWVRPEIICEIKYLEFTKLHKMRSPVFMRLRPDKSPDEISIEQQDIEF